ncbi:hypothetical protein L204_104558 [Cryptococcus depauperatus]|nr:hypothetical protein L204_03419 [Cryptococcus depauperatus CBS 7855]
MPSRQAIPTINFEMLKLAPFPPHYMSFGAHYPAEYHRSSSGATTPDTPSTIISTPIYDRASFLSPFTNTLPCTDSPTESTFVCTADYPSQDPVSLEVEKRMAAYLVKSFGSKDSINSASSAGLGLGLNGSQRELEALDPFAPCPSAPKMKPVDLPEDSEWDDGECVLS